MIQNCKAASISKTVYALLTLSTAVFLFGCQNTLRQKDKVAAATGPTKHSGKWNGTYSFTINGDSEDWRDAQEIILEINKDSILYRAEGYQIYQVYMLSATENPGHALKLHYLSAKDHTESAVLNKTRDFGTISFDGESLVWSSPYIDTSFGNGKKTKPYILKKISH